MKRYQDLKRLSNAVLTFANKDRLSGNESKALLDLIDIQKEIVSDNVLLNESSPEQEKVTV